MNGTQMTLADESPEYAAFVEKFKPKKTTDDCYTPGPIYDVVADWVANRYGIARACFVRPFWPGGDYEREEYPEGCVVVDNPPFSILSSICHFYITHGVRFFLFAPSMTCLGASGRAHVLETNHILCDANITYENGAVVRTGFVTNLDTDGTVLESCPDLGDALNAKSDELRKATTAQLPKYKYPDNVITAAKVQWFAAHHTPYKVNRSDCCHIASLDAMGSKSIFGGGLLLSERAAAERAAAERAAAERAAAHEWELSPREREIIRMISDKAGEDA